MSDPETGPEYDRHIREIAENALASGLSPRSAAQQAIVDTQQVGDEQTILLGSDVLFDEPSRTTRLWPKDVIIGTDHEWSRLPESETVYDLAVEILKVDLYKVMMEIENDTARPWREA